VNALAAQISNDYRESKSILVVALLKGAFVFASDLLKRLCVSRWCPLGDKTCICTAERSRMSLISWLVRRMKIRPCPGLFCFSFFLFFFFFVVQPKKALQGVNLVSWV